MQQLVIDGDKKARIVDERSHTQEQLAYIDAITPARARQLAAGP